MLAQGMRSRNSAEASNSYSCFGVEPPESATVNRPERSIDARAERRNSLAATRLTASGSANTWIWRLGLCMALLASPAYCRSSPWSGSLWFLVQHPTGCPEQRRFVVQSHLNGNRVQQRTESSFIDKCVEEGRFSEPLQAL